MIKVLIVDDDKLVRKGISSAMPWNEFNMEVVGEASNGAKALDFLNPTSRSDANGSCDARHVRD